MLQLEHRAEQTKSVCFVTGSRALLHLLAGETLPVTGGAEVQMSHAALYLANRGWGVSFIVSDIGQDDEILGRANIRLIKGYRHDGGIPGFRRLSHKLPRLWSALKRADASIYVIRGASWMTGLVVFYARRNGRHSVVWMANDKDPVWGLAGYRIDINGYRISRLDGALYGYGLARCDLVVTQTEAQRQVLRQARNLESVVVHNMISCTNNSTRPVPPTVVLWAANFRPVKRPEIMLRVAEKLPHLRFVMIGGPKIGYEALYRECERRAAGMANVDFRGPLPFAETEKYFSEAFVLLLTSASEGFPNVLLQAWAHGTPVVSTFDPDGLIQKHGLGYYCHTVEEIVARIQELVSDSALRNDMGKRAREYVAANHSVEVIMPRVEHMFEDLLR